MTMTMKQRRLRCQRQDDDRNATATWHCCHGAGNTSIVTLRLRCQRCNKDVNASAFDDACIAGAVPTTAMLRRRYGKRYGNATTLALLVPPTMVMQQGHLHCQCRKDGGEAMTMQRYVG
jgi:hypothetical protein